MSLIPDWAPNVHPLVVHFPIALLAAGLVVDLLSLLMRRRPALRHTATWLYCGGAATAGLAYLSGERGADAMLLPAQVAPLVSEHADWAFRTTLFFTFFAAVRLAVSYVLPPRPAVLWAAFVAAVIGVGMLNETAERGGLLVYQHGLGVQAITTDESVDELLAAAGAEPTDPGIIDLQGGSWVWRPVQGAPAVLADQFTWLRGDASGLAAEMVDDQEKGPVLSLAAREAGALFVTGGELDAAQADVYVNLDGFDGELQLVLHAQDDRTFDFFSIAGATATLGRMEDGTPTVFEEGSFDASGWLFLRLFGGDGHFRGYVNGDLLTHGHADDLAPGRFGLRVDGTGTLLVQQIQVQAVG